MYLFSSKREGFIRFFPCIFILSAFQPVSLIQLSGKPAGNLLFLLTNTSSSCFEDFLSPLISNQQHVCNFTGAWCLQRSLQIKMSLLALIQTGTQRSEHGVNEWWHTVYCYQNQHSERCSWHTGGRASLPSGRFWCQKYMSIHPLVKVWLHCSVQAVSHSHEVWVSEAWLSTDVLR